MRLEQPIRQKLSPGTGHQERKVAGNINCSSGAIHVWQVDLNKRIEKLSLTQEILRKSLDTYKEIFNILPVACIILGIDGTILLANKAAASLLGSDILNLQGEPFEEYVLQDDRQLLTGYQNNTSKYIKKISLQVRLMKRDNTVIRAQLESSPLTDEQNKRDWILLTVTVLDNQDNSENDLNRIKRKQMQDEMEFYLREITRVQEEERKRIARELHDDTAQSLACIALELDSLVNTGKDIPEQIVKRLIRLKQQTGNSLKEVRRFSHELRPGVLDQLGLIAALELLVDESNSLSPLQVKFNVTGKEKRLSDEEEQALFRIAQEALSNIRKHSQATSASVNACFSQNGFKLVIMDNGKGFPPEEIEQSIAKGRLGLIGIRERARLVGGVLSMKSAPNKGTIISIELNKNWDCPNS